MKNYLIAERYARGLSLSIKDNAELEAAAAALTDFGEAFDEIRDLRNVLSNPAIDNESRAAVLKAALEGKDMPGTVERLLEVLLRRGRISEVADVAKVFRALVDERLGRVRARVCTALPLDEAQEARMAAALAKRSGKDVRLVCVVDPEILGGAVAEIGGMVLDGSVRAQLEGLRMALYAEEPAVE